MSPGELKRFLNDFGLSMTRLASGSLAKRHGLSLSSQSDAIRRESVSRCVHLVRSCESFPAEVIVGLVKGNPDGDTAAARERFSRSLLELAEECAPGPIPLLLESTNRYESLVADTLDEAAELIRAYAGRGSDNNRLLPGFGGMDFARVFAFLTKIGYSGSLVMEGNTRGSLREDPETSIRFVDRLLQQGSPTDRA